MSRWHAELRCLIRYAGGGILCTVLGFAVIFLAVLLGVPPFAANAAGYGFGLLIGFVFNRKVVFRSSGAVRGQLLRYLSAFGIAFSLNLLALYLFLRTAGMAVMVAQAGAAVIYTAVMYLLSRFYTFGAAPSSGPPAAISPSVKDAVE